MLNVAVIGLGVGAQHLAAYKEIPDCRVVAICDLSGETLASFDEPSVRKAAAPDEILESADVDLISIASFDDHHFEQVMRALRAGKHVFVEKPMCTSMEELRAIHQEWSRRPHLHMQSNLVLRGSPLYQFVSASVEEGAFGDVYAFDGDYLYGRLHKITKGWRKGIANYSVMCGGGIHLVDLMLWITRQRPFEVTAAGNRICSEGSEFRYNDFVSADFKFPSGLIGRITANFGCVHPHQHVLRVFGTRATFLYDDRGARLHRTRDPEGGAEPINLSPFPDSKGSLIPEFVKNIVNGSDMRDKVQHECDVVSACLAADKARESGKTAKVEYV